MPPATALRARRQRQDRSPRRMRAAGAAWRAGGLAGAGRGSAGPRDLPPPPGRRPRLARGQRRSAAVPAAAQRFRAVAAARRLPTAPRPRPRRLPRSPVERGLATGGLVAGEPAAAAVQPGAVAAGRGVAGGRRRPAGVRCRRGRRTAPPARAQRRCRYGRDTAGTQRRLVRRVALAPAGRRRDGRTVVAGIPPARVARRAAAAAGRRRACPGLAAASRSGAVPPAVRGAAPRAGRPVGAGLPPAGRCEPALQPATGDPRGLARSAAAPAAGLPPGSLRMVRRTRRDPRGGRPGAGRRRTGNRRRIVAEAHRGAIAARPQHRHGPGPARRTAGGAAGQHAAPGDPECLGAALRRTPGRSRGLHRPVGALPADALGVPPAGAAGAMAGLVRDPPALPRRARRRRLPARGAGATAGGRLVAGTDLPLGADATGDDRGGGWTRRG